MFEINRVRHEGAAPADARRRHAPLAGRVLRKLVAARLEACWPWAPRSSCSAPAPRHRIPAPAAHRRPRPRRRRRRGDGFVGRLPHLQHPDGRGPSRARGPAAILMLPPIAGDRHRDRCHDADRRSPAASATACPTSPPNPPAAPLKLSDLRRPQAGALLLSQGQHARLHHRIGRLRDAARPSSRRAAPSSSASRATASSRTPASRRRWRCRST